MDGGVDWVEFDYLGVYGGDEVFVGGVVVG